MLPRLLVIGAGGALIVALSLLVGVLVAAEDVGFVVLIPGGSGASEGYTPLAPSLKSVFRLAAEHVAQDGLLSDIGNVSLAVVESGEGASAAANLCSAIGANNTATYAVLNTLGSSSASLIGSFSNAYLHLPILNVRGMAARTDSRDSVDGGGFLLGVKPDIFPQMEALVRLVLDMKLARDALDGRSETEERVWLVHTSDSYGATAAAAFGLAASSYSVALTTMDEDEEGVGEGNATSTTSSSSEGQDASRASVEIVRTTVLPASAAASLDFEMATLAGDEASIIVLLADGFDPAIVRAIFTQARSYGLTEGVQWFLPDAAAMDHIFDHNATYRDAGLAYDMRGTLGVRTCTPLTGTGAERAETLNQVWQRLDPDEYPGAGGESLTADDTMDPLLAFAYDAVFLGAAAVEAAREEVMVQSGANLSAIDLDRCPFPVNGSWRNGSVVRDSVYTSSSTLEGATGLLTMSVGEVADGRDVDAVTFCAVNLRPHTSRGGRFEVIRTMNGASLGEEDGDGFQIISPFQEEQTFPAGSTAYPFDRPLLQGRHLDVVMRRNAPPFVFVEGDGDSNEDFTGITPSFVKSLSEKLGFTYSLRAPPEGTSTDETITMVRNGSADIAGSWITITAERSEYVSFTYPYFDLYMSFVYKPTVSDSVDLWKAFAPFEASLWLTLLFALIGTVILLWLYEGAKNDQFSEGNWGKRRRNVTRGLSRSVYVTASLMMAQLTHKPETLEGYLLTLGWLFTSFVLAASYTAELASFLTATKLETTSLTVEGLKNGEIAHTNVALLQGGNTQYLYQRDFMGCTGDDCSQGPQPQPCFSAEECFEMVTNGTALTAIADSATAEYQLQTNYCDLDILPDSLYPQHYGLVLPFDSALVEEFQKATLELREDGTLDAEVELFLDSDSPCVSTSEAESDQSNMSVGDVSGVFVVLAFFVGLSLCSWCARRSPVAKSVKARRRRVMGPPPEETLSESFSRMSRRQQKAFALEATVKLLQDSKVKEGIFSRPTMGQPILDDPPEVRRARSARRTHMEEIAEGRPVVSLSGSSRSSSFSWGRLRSTRFASRAATSRASGGDSGRRGNGNVYCDDEGDRRRGGTIFSVLRRRPTRGETDQRSVEEQSAPVTSAATNWLAQRGSSEVGGRVVCSSAPSSGSVVAANPDTARTVMTIGDDQIGEERRVSGDSAASIDLRRSLVSAPVTTVAVTVADVADPAVGENQQSGDLSPGFLNSNAMDRL